VQHSAICGQCRFTGLYDYGAQCGTSFADFDCMYIGLMSKMGLVMKVMSWGWENGFISMSEFHILGKVAWGTMYRPISFHLFVFRIANNVKNDTNKHWAEKLGGKGRHTGNELTWPIHLHNLSFDLVWFILRPCQHNDGYIDGRAQGPHRGTDTGSPRSVFTDGHPSKY